MLPTRRAYEHLPKAVKGRVFSDLEALVSLALFCDSKKEFPGQREATRLWGWGRERVQTFLRQERRHVVHLLKPSESRQDGHEATDHTTFKATSRATKSKEKHTKHESDPATNPATNPATIIRLISSDCLSEAPAHQEREAWERLTPHLKTLVGGDAFDQWFRPLRPRALEGGRLTLRAPNPLFEEFIGANYTPDLNDAARAAGLEGVLIEGTA